MTLKEYINQKNPKRKPYVKLQSREYVKGITYKSIMGEIRTQIFITATIFHKTFPELSGEYMSFGTSTLYTVDRDGNPKERSCFNI